jgi:hypothetical protein
MILNNMHISEYHNFVNFDFMISFNNHIKDLTIKFKDLRILFRNIKAFIRFTLQKIIIIIKRYFHMIQLKINTVLINLILFLIINF